MTSKPLTIFISAAEASGDHHAANLMRAIRAQAPDVRFIGAAGPQMAAEGCEVVADLTQKASMVGGPFLRPVYYWRTMRRLVKAIQQVRPDVVVPVDSPALNWHLAAAARACGIAVVYYIAPQVWAWAPWRVRKLARLTTAVACILPFEEEYLRSRGVHATYVGHPLFDGKRGQVPFSLLESTVPPSGLQEAKKVPDPFFPDLGEAWANGTWRVAMVPGSRPAEIRGHTPAMLKLAKAIRHRWPEASCTFTAHDERAAEAIRQACGKEMLQPYDDANGDRHRFQTTKSESVPIYIAIGRTREVLAGSHFGVVKSGTVTLEAAGLGLPMVILYRTGLLMGALHATLGRFRALMPTRYLSLVNILAKRRLVDEIMPWHGNYRRLEQAVMRDMNDLGYLCDLRNSLLELVSSLHASVLASGATGMSPNAADNAARLVLKTIRRD